MFGVQCDFWHSSRHFLALCLKNLLENQSDFLFVQSKAVCDGVAHSRDLNLKLSRRPNDNRSRLSLAQEVCRASGVFAEREGETSIDKLNYTSAELE